MAHRWSPLVTVGLKAPSWGPIKKDLEIQEAWKLENLEVWRLGGLEAWKTRGLEVRRFGGGATDNLRDRPGRLQRKIWKSRRLGNLRI